MTQVATGVTWLLVGIVLIVLNWYQALKEGKFYFVLCLLGPMLAFYGIACLILPADKLFKKSEELVDGETVVSYDKKNLTTLGHVFVALGMIIGGLQFAALKMGWFF